MLRAVDDPADTRRLAVLLGADAWRTLDRARVAAARRSGLPTPTLAAFCGTLLEAIAASTDPVEIEAAIGADGRDGGAA